MSFRDKFSEFSQINKNWRRILMQGLFILLSGATLITLTIFKADVMIFHARDMSWLPVCGFVVLVVGLLECIDAFIGKELKDFFLNLQNGLLDVVVGSLIVFSAGDDPARLSLLIAAFLIIKGAFRTILSYAINSSNIISTRIGAGVSIVLGLLIWMEWPTSAAWFLAFCLSTEMALRGWAVIIFAFWLKSQQQPE